MDYLQDNFTPDNRTTLTLVVV